MKQRILGALAAVAVLITIGGTASAAPYNLVGWYQRSGGGNLSSLGFKAGAAQGCPGPNYIQPCYNPAQAWAIANNVVAQVSAGAPTWDWNTATDTLTSTGLFWASSFISSNPGSSTVISDKVTNLVIQVTSPGVGATNAATYECVEGTFLATVAASGCENTYLGANVLDNTTTAWNVSGNPKWVTQVIGGDDFGLADGGQFGDMAYNTQTANFTVGTRVKGQTSGVFGTITADVDGGVTGTLSLISIAGANFAPGNFTAGEIINEVDGPGSAKVTAAPVTSFTVGTPEPRGLTAQLANQAGAGAVKTSGAFDAWHVAVDAGGILILSESANLGTCYLFGVEAEGGCTVEGSGSYLVFVAPGTADTDSDGNFDGLDNCISIANPGQLDTDGDAIGNDCDTDDDGDTIADGSDNCPLIANADQANADGDAVGNVCDNCRLVSNTAAGTVPNSPGVLASQLDADGDKYGNLCDGDLNNSGLTTAQDNTILRNVLNQAYNFSANAAKSDLNGSGLVTAQDNTILRNRLNQLPGPSGFCNTVPAPTNSNICPAL